MRHPFGIAANSVSVATIITIIDMRNNGQIFICFGDPFTQMINLFLALLAA